MRVIDLFCGSGGASMGIRQAAFSKEIVGVDIVGQPNYPFDFILGDAMDIHMSVLRSFDFIWASPPCQAFSKAARQHRDRGKEYPDYISATRAMLKESGVPYVIENVEHAPLDNYIFLCGTMFPELRVIRHRIFECSFPFEFPFVYGLKCNHKGKATLESGGEYYTVAGHMTGSVEEWGRAMGIDWMATKEELAQAIPPAYSRFVFNRFAKWYRLSRGR